MVKQSKSELEKFPLFFEEMEGAVPVKGVVKKRKWLRRKDG